MISLASFFGFMIGVALGTITAAATGSKLQAEAEQWIRESRWRVYGRRDTWRFPALLQQVLNLLQLEILFILFCLWIVGLLWAIFLTPSWDHQSYIHYIVGSLVGTAASPWIWLHFTRSFGERKSGAGGTHTRKARTGTEKPVDDKHGNDKREEKASAESDLFARYRFVTFMLGAALLVAILQPYLHRWLSNAQKIEGFGIALSFTQPRNELGAHIPFAGQNNTSSFGDTTGRLSSATLLAHRVASGQRTVPSPKGLVPIELVHVTASTQEFGNLSVMDRDKVYIAYLNHERNVQRGTVADFSKISNLKDYVGDFEFVQAPDDEFLAKLAGLAECVWLYAEHLRDFRLFLVDSGSFLRELLVDVAAQWGEATAAARAVMAARGSHVLKLEKATPFAGQIVDALKKRYVSGGAQQCANSESLIPPEMALNGIGKTPYPAYLSAHYLAAIDSVESGVVVLRDWLLYQKERVNIENDPEQAWYAVRAMLASSQLPYRFGSVPPTHRALVQFQLETTDRIAKLLGVHDARTWRSLCKRLAQPGLHAQIGRYLAMTYADERNYLYELLRPEDFGLPQPRNKALKVPDMPSPAIFLDEAEAILESTDCFAGVPRFTRFNRKLVALYHLNAAQLRYSVRLLADGIEKRALTQKIRSDLERATALDEDEDKGDILDLLRQPGQFELPRARLARFRNELDKEAEND
jgi:hypothetical protein